MDNTSTLKENLYMWCPLEVEAILALLQLEMIVDDTPEGEDIAMAVWRLQMGRAVGPSGMRADNIKVWKRELTHEKDPDTRRWEKLVSVTKLASERVAS